MRLLSILLILSLQLSTCNNEEKKPISNNAKIEFRLAEKTMYDGYEEKEMDGEKIYLNRKVEITRNDIDFVIKSVNEYNEMPVIMLEMNEPGTQKFATLTANNLKKMLAILVNNEVLMAPVIQEKITEGKVQITGNFDNKKINEIFKTLTE